MESPVELQQHCGQRLRNSVASEDLLNRVEVTRADFRAGIFVGGLRQRTEDRPYRRRQKFPVFAKALQSRPFERKEIFIERFIAGAASVELLPSGIERFANQGSSDCFFRREIIK